MIPYFSFALLGALGLMGSSVLFPLIAVAVELVRRKIPSTIQVPVASLDILIPAHNEEKMIEATLQALRQSITGALFPIRILVAADACTDSTEARASLATELYSVNFKNKWKSLRSLVDRSDAEWVAFVDCGTVWTADFFNKIVPFCERQENLVVCPAYAPSRVSFAAEIHWKIEQILKQLESDAGGPISLHGATIFYRRSALQTAFAWLDSFSPGEPWLNDDVVIPLAIRATHPHGRIEYLSLWRHRTSVSDLGVSEIRDGRRSRLARGNLQWMSQLLIPLRDLNPDAYLIAMRRVFRVFWAYWILFLGMGITHSVGAGLIFIAVAYFIPQRAVWASLQAPWQWRAIKKGHPTPWA